MQYKELRGKIGTWVWVPKVPITPRLPMRSHYDRGFVFRKEIKKTMSTQEKKPVSLHHQLVVFFSDTALYARGFRPTISPQDAVKLKKAIEKDIFSQSQWEQVMLYFLADRSFRNLSPSIVVMLSPTVLNGLRNKAINREQFYTEIEKYRGLYVNRNALKGTGVGVTTQEPRGMVSIADKLKQMQDQLQKRKEVQG